MTLNRKSLEPPNMATGYFGNYQLLGDSQFVRFCVEILDLKSTLDEKGRAQVGFCVSGQDTTELAKLVVEHYITLNDNLIIMIGTNDVKNEVQKIVFKEAIYILKSTLEWKNVLWLTIPPLPKYQNSETHKSLLKYFNKEIMNLHGSNIRVLDVHNLFLDGRGFPRTYCFEEYYHSRKPPYRRDDIHLNRRGLIKLCAWLCFHILPEKNNVLQQYRERKGSIVRVKLYQEFRFLVGLLPNSSGITGDELYYYIMGLQKNYM